ncbi:MAG: response regulator [Ghiorsea sp.]
MSTSSPSVIKNLTPTSFVSYLKLIVGMIAMIAMIFLVYVWSEKQIDHANNMRLQSHKLTDQLRQSSDELTGMVRTYIATGDPRYKKFYQDIIDIRNGKISRPANYDLVYWDFIRTGEIESNIDTSSTVSLLDLMKQVGFPVQELQKLSDSKSRSDKLAEIERGAMNVFESSVTEHKKKALSMLYDDNYHLAKAGIMRPINEVTFLMDGRTSDAVSNAENRALMLRILFVGFVLGLALILFRLYSLLKGQLGGSLSKVQQEITRIGSADFTTKISVPVGLENSVLGWLAKMQSNLIQLDHERKFAEDATKFALEEARKIANLVPGVVYQFRLNPDGTSCFPFASDAIEEIYRVKSKDVREDASKVFEILHPDDLDDVSASIQESSQALTLWQCEYRVRFDDGTVRWLFGNAMPERETDGGTVWYGFITDITERKKREQFDIDQLHIMELIADTSVPLGTVLEVIVIAVQRYQPALLGSILLMDEEGKHLRHGAAPDLPAAYCEALDGVEIGASVGSCGTAAYTGEQVIVSDIATDSLWANFKGLALEYGLAACWSQPITDSHKQVLGTFAMYYKEPRSPKENDINLLLQAGAIAANAISRRKADQVQVDMQAQVEHMQRLESLGVLAGGIAHDFNNILTVILGNAAMAERKAVVNPRATQGYLSNIVNSSERASDLCKQMLAYSGKGKFVVRSVDLSAMVAEITNLLEISISKSVVLKYHLTPQLPAVMADAAQMQQVIMNLVINASDAIADKSGVISVNTGVMHVDRAYLSSTSLDDDLPEGRYVYLEVSDTGKGMDKETQAKVFEPFFTTKFTGRGLGMSAVLGIVRGHAGAIKLYSEVDRGTTFKMLLPMTERPADALFPLEAVNESWRGSGTVLIVDDEETIREMASMMLEEMGFDTLTAQDGVHGAEVYSEHQKEVVVVLMDMTMPKMDGKACFTELRRINKDVKVILSSGYNEQEAISSFAGQGLAGFIQKPYTPKALQAKLQQLLK